MLELYKIYKYVNGASKYTKTGYFARKCKLSTTIIYKLIYNYDKIFICKIF